MNRFFCFHNVRILRKTKWSNLRYNAMYQLYCRQLVSYDLFFFKHSATNHNLIFEDVEAELELWHFQR